MSWFIGEDKKRYELFGSGGGQLLADELKVPLLAQIPLLEELREGGDTGRPISAISPESEVGLIFAQLAKRIAEDMKPKKVFSAALKVN
jgi:ATP-binding protein involved in chromosome partitioning